MVEKVDDEKSDKPSRDISNKKGKKCNQKGKKTKKCGRVKKKPLNKNNLCLKDTIKAPFPLKEDTAFGSVPWASPLLDFYPLFSCFYLLRSMDYNQLYRNRGT